MLHHFDFLAELFTGFYLAVSLAAAFTFTSPWDFDWDWDFVVYAAFSTIFYLFFSAPFFYFANYFSTPLPDFATFYYATYLTAAFACFFWLFPVTGFALC